MIICDARAKSWKLRGRKWHFKLPRVHSKISNEYWVFSCKSCQWWRGGRSLSLESLHNNKLLFTAFKQLSFPLSRLLICYNHDTNKLLISVCPFHKHVTRPAVVTKRIQPAHTSLSFNIHAPVTLILSLTVSPAGRAVSSFSRLTHTAVIKLVVNINFIQNNVFIQINELWIYKLLPWCWV